ncbi:cell death-inducing p53-target protein 1 homolog [Gouania willdenowi]|uniref:Cell death-inducing p53-target protein 1 homolog n=1 Tax=Gouania willdenowi TaxID=441366 RepID=A0A8C5DP23_GOUWI|nr:cell death-inducing p53-target protein 1 homolog [Gouania willdenowi]
MESKADESFPSPPPYLSPGESNAGFEVGIYEAYAPYSAPSTLPAHVSFPEVGSFIQTHSPLSVSSTASYVPKAKFVCQETPLYRTAALTTCTCCETRVRTQVNFRAGRYAWLVCFVFVLCGLFLGCCLIPFFLNYFKDVYHTCPHCRRVLHVQKKTFCE